MQNFPRYSICLSRLLWWLVDWRHVDGIMIRLNVGRLFLCGIKTLFVSQLLLPLGNLGNIVQSTAPVGNVVLDVALMIARCDWAVIDVKPVHTCWQHCCEMDSTVQKSPQHLTVQGAKNKQHTWPAVCPLSEYIYYLFYKKTKTDSLLYLSSYSKRVYVIWLERAASRWQFYHWDYIRSVPLFTK